MQKIKITLLLLLVLPLFSVAQSFPDKPFNYVTDSADVLSKEEERLLNHKLRSFQDSTSTQLFVYIAPSLDGNNMASLCQEIFVKWKIGQKNKNNGVLIGVFVKEEKNRIHTGYGMEGVLPDLLTKKIQREEMQAAFKEKKYYEGLNKGIDKLIFYSKNEFKSDTAAEPVRERKKPISPMWWFYGMGALCLILFFLMLTYSLRLDRSSRLIILGIFLLLLAIPYMGFVFNLMALVVTLIIRMRGFIDRKSEGKYSTNGSNKRGSVYNKSSENSGTTYTDYTSNTDSSDYSTYSSNSDSNYSSSSDSDYSSSSDSDFGGGEGGDSGGGGSDGD